MCTCGANRPTTPDSHFARAIQAFVVMVAHLKRLTTEGYGPKHFFSPFVGHLLIIVCPTHGCSCFYDPVITGMDPIDILWFGFTPPAQSAGTNSHPTCSVLYLLGMTHLTVYRCMMDKGYP